MVIIFGPVGAGKSVQGQLIAARHGWRWISAGQLLRSTYDHKLMEVMKTGELVDAATINHIVLEALKQSKDVRYVVLDGFPRTLEQMEWLIHTEPQHERTIQLVIVLEVRPEEIQRRLYLRARADDTSSAIRRRLEIYETNISAVLDYLEQHHIKVVHIDGNGAIEVVNQHIEEELERCSLV